jgi:hypothetical protein
MRPTIRHALALVLITTAACEPPPELGEDDVESVQQLAQSYGRSVHAEGRTLARPNDGPAMTLKVWDCWNNDFEAHPTVSCAVDSDYVLVGGGAHTVTSAPGALLTASYPDSGLTKWTASSKDHGEPHPHRLHVFAHGLKVKGLTAAELRANLKLQTRTSAKVAHPKLEAGPVPAPGADQVSWALLSVGARVDYGTGPGAMLTAIWRTAVAAKDHGWANPSTITSYELFIKKVLKRGSTTVCNVDLVWTENTTPVVETGLSAGNLRPMPGYLEIGAFAYSIYWNAGRLLIGHGYSTGRSPTVAWEPRSKDHLWADRGQILAGMTQMLVY